MTVKVLKNISESSKKSYMYMYGVTCVHLWTSGHVEGRTDRRMDGRTCDDIVLSHDHKNLKNISESSRKSYMHMYGLAGVHLYMWTDRHEDGRTDIRTDR